MRRVRQPEGGRRSTIVLGAVECAALDALAADLDVSRAQLLRVGVTFVLEAARAQAPRERVLFFLKARSLTIRRRRRSART